MAVVFANTQAYTRNSDQLTVGSHSFCAWIYRTSANSVLPGLFIAAWDTPQTDYLYFDTTSGTDLLELASNEANFQVASPTFPLNVWRFVAYSQPSGANNGTAWIWDTAGTMGTASGATRCPTNTIVSFSIASAATGYGLLGRMAGAKLWSAALTQAEFEREMWSLRPQRMANLHSWLPWVGGASGVDYSGSGNTWTAAGSPTSGDGPPVGWGAAPYIIGNPAAAGPGGRNPVSMGFDLR
jgi:hypothetical protein